jgi:hypothetical protein
MFCIKLENVRADAVTSSTVDGWFVKVHSILLKLDLLNKPQQATLVKLVAITYIGKYFLHTCDKNDCGSGK